MTDGPSGFRSIDEQALVEAARQRANAAYGALMTAAKQAHVANASLVTQGFDLLQVGTFSPPTVAPNASPADAVRLLDGQTQWYQSETARLEQLLSNAQRTLARVNEPAAPLAPGPRPVPLAMVIAELVRGPWTWMRWLLFPPFTMLAGVLVGVATTSSPIAGTAALSLLLVALWVYGIGVGLQRVRLLAIGEVATVLQKTERFGAARNRNVPMLRARGWNVSVESYSGMSKKTDLVVQSSKGVIGKLTVSHGPTFDGVVLVDPDTGKGCSNLEFGSTPQPDANGQWKSSLSARTWLTTIAALCMTAGFIGLLIAIATGELVIVG